MPKETLKNTPAAPLVEVYHGSATGQRCPLGADRTVVAAAQTSTFSLPRTQAHRPAEGSHGDHLRAQNRHPVGRTAAGDGLWLRYDLLELSPSLAAGGSLGAAARNPLGRTSRSRPHRLVAGGRGQHARTGLGRKRKTGKTLRLEANGEASITSSPTPKACLWR
jgi:hypothetical protein